MIASIEIFKEKGFNSDLTGNFFDFVFFNSYHIGLGYRNFLLHFIFQTKNKTLFFNIWFSKKRARDYFKNCPENSSYKKHILGKV